MPLRPRWMEGDHRHESENRSAASRVTSGRRCAALTVAWLLSFGIPLHGQTVGTLEAATSIVEYDGFLVSGAAVLSPSLRYNVANFSLGAQGTWVIFESGNQILQGTAAAAWLSPAGRRWRAEFSGSMGVSKYADSPGYGHILGRTRIHYQGARSGAWASAATGVSFGGSDVAPLELTMGAWSSQRDLTFVGTLTRSWVAGHSYVDMVGAARWSHPRVQVDAQAGARPWTDSEGGVGTARRGVYGELLVDVSLSDRLTLALGGGHYPADPMRGVLAASYVTAGVRLKLFGARRSTAPVVSRAIVQAADELAASDYGSRARLVIAEAGSPRTFRVLVSNARSVDLIGDFTDWVPMPLTRVGPGSWEIALPIGPGVYRLNVRVNGGPWLVPQGTRLEETEYGGAVGVVVVGGRAPSSIERGKTNNEEMDARHPT